MFLIIRFKQSFLRIELLPRRGAWFYNVLKIQTGFNWYNKKQQPCKISYSIRKNSLKQDVRLHALRTINKIKTIRLKICINVLDSSWHYNSKELFINAPHLSFGIGWQKKTKATHWHDGKSCMDQTQRHVKHQIPIIILSFIMRCIRRIIILF